MSLFKFQRLFGNVFPYESIRIDNDEKKVICRKEPKSSLAPLDGLLPIEPSFS